jgi:uncharacterized protein (DUF1330 family)
MRISSTIWRGRARSWRTSDATPGFGLPIGATRGVQLVLSLDDCAVPLPRIATASRKEYTVSTFNLDAIRESTDDGAVTMLNLVKYRERSTDGAGSGRDAYKRYTDAAVHEVESRGGKVLWAGVVSEAALQDGMTDDEADWDWALLVYYPSRAAFLDMVTSPDYLAANEHRLSGLAKHAILATKTLMIDQPPGAAKP